MIITQNLRLVDNIGRWGHQRRAFPLSNRKFSHVSIISNSTRVAFKELHTRNANMCTSLYAYVNQ